MRYLELHASKERGHIETLHRLSVRLSHTGRASEAKLTLLRASVESLKQDSVSAPLAEDCSALLNRSYPQVVKRLLEACTERTISMLMHTCRNYSALGRLRRFYVAAVELMSMNSEQELTNLRNFIVKSKKIYEEATLFKTGLNRPKDKLNS